MLNPFARSMLIDNLTHGFQSRCSVLQFTPATPFDYWLLLNDCSLFDEVTTISVQGCPKANFPITPCLIFFIVLFLWLFTDWWRDPSYCAGIPNSKLWWLLFLSIFFGVLDYGCSLLDDMTPIFVMEEIFLKYDFCCAYLWYVQSNLNSQFIILCQII